MYPDKRRIRYNPALTAQGLFWIGWMLDFCAWSDVANSPR
jgi:hypothetical protein